MYLLVVVIWMISFGDNNRFNGLKISEINSIIDAILVAMEDRHRGIKLKCGSSNLITDGIQSHLMLNKPNCRSQNGIILVGHRRREFSTTNEGRRRENTISVQFYSRRRREKNENVNQTKTTFDWPDASSRFVWGENDCAENGERICVFQITRSDWCVVRVILLLCDVIMQN